MNVPKILIVGSPRSGTTLINGIVCNNINTYPQLPECTYITQLIRHCNDFILYSDVPRFKAYGKDREQLVANYKLLTDSLIQNALASFDYVRNKQLVMKDPELTLLIDHIPEFFGDESKIIGVIRDPRAVFASFRKVQLKKKAAVFKHFRKNMDLKSFMKFLDSTIELNLLLDLIFNYYWRLHDSDLYKNGRVHIVTYENILSGDNKEFESLENYLGFELNKKGFGELPFGFDETDPTFSKNYGKTISNPETNFRDSLSSKSIRKVENVFSGLNEIYQWW